MTKVNMISETKEQKSISVTDEFSFADNGEIRAFFNLNGKCQKAFYIINRDNKDHLWLPHLSIIEDNNRIISTTEKGHFNIYENENTIQEKEKTMKLKMILFSTILTLAGTSPAFAQTVLTYSDHEPYGNMRTRFINDVFFKNVEAESNGRIKIEPHWGGEITTAHKEFEAIEEKRTDLIVAVPEYNEKRLPLHQLFKSFLIGPSGNKQVETLRQIYQNIPELTAEYEANGVKPVLIATGYPVAFFSVNKLENLDQIKGQTWRSASFWHRDFLKNAGATPTTSRWGQETYDKLANGEMHGLMVNIDSAIDIKAYEHTPYALVSKQMWLGHIYPVVINLDRWNSLDEQDRKAFEQDWVKTKESKGVANIQSVLEKLRGYLVK